MHEDLREIEKLFAAMAESWNRHDLEAYCAAWIEDLDFVNVIGMHRSGRKELRAEVDYLHADRFKNTQIRITRSKVRFLSPDIAVAHAWWEMTGDPGIPGFPTENERRQGVFTHVVQRTAQGWRLVASQNTDRLPIPDPIHAGDAELAGARA